MIHRIRTSKFSKVIASYLAIQLILTTVQPTNLYALTGGPSQPEFNAFTPLGTSDMVNLSSGDFNYNIPIMDVGGYPINLAYNSGVTMDQEASWVGLGWNLSVGQINRQVRGLPDDFDGDRVTYENNLKDNITVGLGLQLHPAVAGNDFLSLAGMNLAVEYNNYQGVTFKPSVGLSFNISDNNSVDLNLSTSTTQGATVEPTLKLGQLTKDRSNSFLTDLEGNYGLKFNSRKGITDLTISNDITKSFTNSLAFSGSSGGSYIDASFAGSNTLSFANTTFTPKKRNPYKNQNFGFNYALGVEIFLAEFQGEIYAYASTQSMKDRITSEKVYGYENTEKGSKNDVLDFNREKDRAFSKNTTTLPIPNYTYDVYNINGQGIGGTFRPFRSQVGYVYDKFIKDRSDDVNFGLEIGSGAYVHIAGDLKFQPSWSSTGRWENGNNARSNFREKTTGNELDYEKVYFKNIGEMNVDNEANILNDYLGGDEPIHLGLKGFILDKKTISGRYFKNATDPLNATSTFNKVKRKSRIVRRQGIQKLNLIELNNLTQDYGIDNKPVINASAKDHHTVAMRIIQEDGSRYNYLQPLYNTKKVESTFNVSDNAGDNNCTSGLVNYGGNDDSIDNSNGKDNFFNRITTPSYAHTYLLSNVLSSDYEDLTNDGPTDDDLGTYTKFSYEPVDKRNPNYSWRVPFAKDKATLNEGLNSLSSDQTGNYIYGEKELKYIHKIETKTHVAVFDFNERNDGYGVIDDEGGLSTDSKMYQIKTISLYSKPEYQKLQEGNNTIEPIKVAHFEYDYSLCIGVPNNSPSSSIDENEYSNGGGKLTLKKVYFTYRGSNMGKYTPYEFTYSGLNPVYDIKAYDMWGNYKVNDGSCGISGSTINSEFPYVIQNKDEADENVSSWSLNKIDMPSGGNIEVHYESDDYQYVQDKKALQMFKVVGVSNNGSLEDIDRETLYSASSSNETKYVFIEIDEDINASDFKSKYIGDLQNEVIYFRFLMNMIDNTSNKYDYVTGYFELDDGEAIVRDTSPGVPGALVAVPVKTVRMEGGVDGNRQVNPFSKAGWNFARTHLNRLAYSQNGSEDNFDISSIVDDIISQIQNISEIFKGPNKYLRDAKCANKIVRNKSWIRLQNPNGKKLGGGVRVSKIEMNDEWDEMTGNAGNPVYSMQYGQEYSYNNIDGTSSGVATYEPAGSKENPFVVPFEDHDTNKLLAPAERNYVEGPLGNSFFPSPMVTYGRVEVKNLDRQRFDATGVVIAEVRKHATGKMVNEFYTSRDFPTIAKHTAIDNHYNEIGTGALASFFSLNIYQDRHLALSQGFSVIINDMNGKQKSVKVFPEGAIGDEDAISKVDYKYFTKDNGELDNDMVVYDEEGRKGLKTLGVHYDVVNDFRTSNSSVISFGADINLAIIPFPFIPPALTFVSVTNINFAYHRNTMRAAATTKVIYKTGILKEKIASDLGSTVSTRNLVFEGSTGDVLLTEMSNEYNDNYYNLNYPAYWAYKGMSQATKNLDIVANIKYNTSNYFEFNDGIAGNHLYNGDEVWLRDFNTKLWVTNVGDNGQNSFDLMNAEGTLLTGLEISEDQLKIMRSGYRNLHSASMASVTTMKNPLFSSGTQLYGNIRPGTLVANDWDDYRVISTSGVKYSDTWASQCECDLPETKFDSQGNIIKNQDFNPYLYNVFGDWRAEGSYAYLIGRYNGTGDPNPRNSGFLLEHDPFYKYNGANWVANTTDDRWTNASEATQYSPYGAELENVDALGRYSSAQYGFNYNYPIAVSTNSKYKEMGFDSFEDEEMQCEDGHFNFKRQISQNNAGITISNTEAHSGRKSIKVNPNNVAVIEARLVKCDSTQSN